MEPTEVAFTVRLQGTPVWSEGPLLVGLQSGRDALIPGEVDGCGTTLAGRFTAFLDRDGKLDFRGPLVHGKRGERFVYVWWGVARPEGHAMFRRLKLHLGPLTRASWSQPGIDAAMVGAGRVALMVPATMADGTPACGSAAALWERLPA